jgi:signal transduction histidine kinase
MVSDLRSQLALEVATGVTAPPTPRPHWQRRGRLDFVFLADFALAVICFGATNSMLGEANARAGGQHSGALLLVTSFILCAPLVLRTRWPLTAWATSAAAIGLTAIFVSPSHLAVGPYLFTEVLVYGLCLYAVSVRCRTWIVMGAVLVTTVSAALINANTAASAVFLTAIPVLGGVVVRSRRSNRQQLEVAEQRHQGERAVLEERQRIARELHDVVAHHMSVIAIAAEAAPYKTADPPTELVESFADIRASALSGLGELRRLLGVLRSETPGTAPTPGLDALDSLLDSARSGGVTVTREITGTPRPLTAGVDLSAYRIVQEGLSNAMRHAPGSRVQVSCYFGEAALVIEVRNSAGADGSRPLGRGAGHGIIGMRERVTMLGGHLSVGPTKDGEFLVTAALPLDGAEQGPAEQAPALPAADTDLEDAS